MRTEGAGFSPGRKGRKRGRGGLSWASGRYNKTCKYSPKDIATTTVTTTADTVKTESAKERSPNIKHTRRMENGPFGEWSFWRRSFGGGMTAGVYVYAIHTHTHMLIDIDICVDVWQIPKGIKFI